MVRRFAFIAAAFVITGCGGVSVQPAPAPASDRAAVPDSGTNLVSNSGFEALMNTGVVTCSGVNQSVGNWQPYAQTNGLLPFTENSVVHAGALSLEVHTPGAPQGCGGGAVYQDLQSPFPAATSYTFSYWALPSLGQEQQSVIFAWGHAGGPSVGSDNVFIEPTQTVFDAWGRSKIGSAVSYGTWHQFTLSVDAATLTATLKVDGRSFGSTSPGDPQTAEPITVYIGQGSGAPPSEDHFYYDSVSLDTSPHVKKATPSSVHQGLTHQKVTLAGTNFSPSATVMISGTGVTVTGTSVKTASKIVIYLDVDGSATLGPRDITVTTSGGGGKCTGCLSVVT